MLFDDCFVLSLTKFLDEHFDRTGNGTHSYMQIASENRFPIRVQYCFFYFSALGASGEPLGARGVVWG